jgi:ABC-2 type transport system permease protein
MLRICFSFFIPVPAILPILIATYSVVIEKERHSLEPLLVTPVSTIDLLLGKALSALIPSVLLCWVSFGLLLILVQGTLKPAAVAALDLPFWISLILLWTPLMAGASTLLGVAISSRSRDARAAQQLGGLVVLPVVLLVLAFAMKLLEFTLVVLVSGVIIGVIANALLLYLALKIFQRETILTRWR